jgi:hypothetical protein
VLAYLYLALRRVYGGGRLATTLKTLAIFVLYIALLIVVSIVSLPDLRSMVWGMLRS